MIEQTKGFKVYGKICVKETGTGIPNLIVEALDKDLFFEDRLGSVLTDESGSFEILYDREDFQELFFDLKPDIYLRVRRADGRVIYTTESAVSYEAGKTEAFYIPIPKSLIEEEENMKESNYLIQGTVSSDVLREVPEGISLKVYAIRDRRLVGASTIGDEGNFVIEYKYEVYEEEGRKQALGVYLVVAPDMPAEKIMRESFPKVFLKSDDFQGQEGKFHASVSSETIHQLISKEIILKYLIPWWKFFCHQWRPCVQILSCAKIDDGLCYSEQPIENAHVRIYAIRQPLLFLVNQPPPPKYSVLVAEGNTDLNGYFKTEQTICQFFWLYTTLGYKVEVGQMIDGAFHSLYLDPDNQLRELKTDLCEEVYVKRTDLVEPQDPEGLLTGKTFKLTRIGNIPIHYVQSDQSSPFYGYANTVAATDSATLKVIDCAFYDTIKLFANIGADLCNTVKYYRIKYTYQSNGKTIESELQIPFYNLRESTPAEKDTFGSYKTEFMGPINGVYTYPNPYDLGFDKQWVYKGLIAVINTRTLPSSYGKYTLTVIPLDINKNPVTVTNPTELSCTILVDNTAPTGILGDICGPNNQIVTACGFLQLPSASPSTKKVTCQGNEYERKVVTGEVVVPFSAQDEHGNLYKTTMEARFGGACDAPILLGVQDYDAVVPLVDRPQWTGSSQYSVNHSGNWDECAYEFRLTIHKRLTNGEVVYPWWTFSKYITIAH